MIWNLRRTIHVAVEIYKALSRGNNVSVSWGSGADSFRGNLFVNCTANQINRRRC